MEPISTKTGVLGANPNPYVSDYKISFKHSFRSCGLMNEDKILMRVSNFSYSKNFKCVLTCQLSFVLKKSRSPILGKCIFCNFRSYFFKFRDFVFWTHNKGLLFVETI